MADNVAITAGSGTTIAADDVGGVLTQRVKVQWGPDGTVNDADVASGKPLPVQLRGSGGTELTQGAGAVAATTLRATLASDDPAVAFLSVMDDWDETNRAAVNVISGQVGAAAGAGVTSAATLRVALASDSPGVTATGQTTAASSLPVVLASDKGTQPTAFSVAATTCTRPANTTQYAVGDSISDNGTAGSVTALSATVSDTNDSPVAITHITVDTNDTGIGAATTALRAYIYNSDPTASSGVGGGDNAAFSNKRAGLVGTFTGFFTAMSDGGKAVLIPESGAPSIVAKPTSGAKTVFIQYQIISGTPTPSANSTTLIGTISGLQAR